MVAGTPPEGRRPGVPGMGGYREPGAADPIQGLYYSSHRRSEAGVCDERSLGHEPLG